MSDEKLTIYHNPACSKSRETLQILESNDQNPEIVEYLSEPPDKLELERIIKLLGVSARDLLRTTEEEYKKANLNDLTISDQDIIGAICKYPVLLQRPIVVAGNRAVIGRPPVRVLDIISSD